MKLEGTHKDELLELGLDIHDIAIHQERIQQSLCEQATGFLPIEDTCRLDNYGIFPQRYLHSKSEEPLRGFVAFVPAAGAASRYFQPLHKLREALSEASEEKLIVAKQELLDAGALSWPLPPKLRLFLEQKAHINPRPSSDILEELDLPKALLPCYTQGESFLRQKQREHEALAGLDAQIFVAPLGQAGRFAHHLQGESSRHLPTIFLEQGPELSTLRFLRSGLPYRDQNGRLSLVPAGHGVLVKLFPEIHKQFPEAHSLFIRNIDNVNGCEPRILEATGLFLRQHQTMLRSIRRIRRALHQENLDEASQLGQELLGLFRELPELPAVSWLRDCSEPWRSLWLPLILALRCPHEFAEQLRAKLGDSGALRKLYDRPFNSLGQVPNLGTDVGGTPILTKTHEGLVSLCLELPHASPADRQFFLENPRKATHFNPVFVAAEIPTHHHVYDLKQCPFWILAQKQIHGQAVVYHEIVLYEVLGNSVTANLNFPEIPRYLFNPHKTLLDGVRRN